MTALGSLRRPLSDQGLFVSGVVSGGPSVAENIGSILLISPDEPEFWSILITSKEWLDEKPHPIDRWSARVISGLANLVDGSVYLPSDGPDYPPFISWALSSGQFWVSPVGLLVHKERGLFASFRGAIAIKEHVSVDTGVSPCDSCHRPCLRACPVSALAAEEYDTSACHDYLDTVAGRECMDQGCSVRRSCPIGQGRRTDAQSAYHMKMFHP
jgi:epoxyqueuosine reductase